MSKKNDLVGQKFGTLTPKEIIGVKRGRRVWLCTCDCGNTKEVVRDDLLSGNVKSCGQCQRSTMPKDLTGQIFGKLTVIAKAENKGVKTAWLCRCECGKEKVIKTNRILQGGATGCGCEINYNKVNYSGRRFGRLLVIEKFARQGSHMHYLCQCDCGQNKIVSSSCLKSKNTNSCGCLQKELASKLMSSKRGALNPSWKGGISLDDPRNTKEYSDWRKGVIKRDKCCQICGDAHNLEAHHLYSFVDNPLRRHDIENGVALCWTCHKVFHIDHGSGSNTPEQFHCFKSSLGL